MLVTALEIVLFMIAAALLGALLGWVLRGLFSNEQIELVDLRSELRKCKKARREAVAQLESSQIVAVEADSSNEADEDATQAETQATARKAVEKLVKRMGKTDETDDLTKIYGVGPKFAGLLNDMNITSFRQVASFGADEIDTVASALGAFKDRVTRDNWPKGAKKAYKEVYGKSL